MDNIKTAKEQERQLRDWIRQAGDYFKPIAPIPDTGTSRFKRGLRQCASPDH